jgi:hypothetical protein
LGIHQYQNLKNVEELERTKDGRSKMKMILPQYNSNLRESEIQPKKEAMCKRYAEIYGPLSIYGHSPPDNSS